MRDLAVFLRKELRELVRTKRLLILLGLFVVVGIMNPAVAKLTPVILEMTSESMAEMGVTIGEVKVTSLDCWTQFVKNMPIALIVTLIMFSGIYTTEYTKGTLVLLLTKGLSRSSAVLAKFAAMLITWSVGSLLCFGITYFYSAYYWDNSAVNELFFSAFCWWLFGAFMLCGIVFFSSFAGSGAHVMLGVGGAYVVMTLIGISAKAKEYLPTHLIDSSPLYTGDAVPSDYLASAAVTVLLSVGLVIAALPLTKKRQL